VLLFGQAPDWPYLLISAAAAALCCAAGYTLFKRLEKSFPDAI
jgi:hypothetical protein